MAVSAGSGLITKPSKYSVQETIERFETAINPNPKITGA